MQTGLAAPVVSNEETVRFAPVGDGRRPPVFLPIETVTRQIVLIAGRNILVEKATRFSEFQLNPADFEARRAEARRSDRVMYRETDKGLRYYVKEGDTRVVSDQATTSAKAMAMGVTIDPSFAFPLPILGINYLDFEFGSPDTQLAMLFAGVLVPATSSGRSCSDRSTPASTSSPSPCPAATRLRRRPGSARRSAC